MIGSNSSDRRIRGNSKLKKDSGGECVLTVAAEPAKKVEHKVDGICLYHK